MSDSPARRGSGPVDLGALAPKKLKKAPNRSVIEELTERKVPEVVPPVAVTAPAVTVTPVADPAPAATALGTQEQPAHVPVQAPDPEPAVVAAPVTVAAPAAPAPAPAAPVEVPAEPAKEKPTKTGFFQTKDQGDRMRRTYFDTSPMTQYATLSEFINAAVEEKCAQLEEEYNDGEPFTQGSGKVRRGRPIGR